MKIKILTILLLHIPFSVVLNKPYFNSHLKPFNFKDHPLETSPNTSNKTCRIHNILILTNLPCFYLNFM